MQITKHTFMQIIISAILILILPLCAFAAPTINDAPSTVQSGSSIVITSGGNDFGVGSTIISWDNFEAHTVGNTIHNTSPVVGPNWTLQRSSYPEVFTVSDTRARGSKAVYANWSTDPVEHGGFGWAGQGPYDEVYITYWRYMTGDYTSSNPTCNHKQWYLFGDGTGDFPQAMALIPAGSTRWGYYNNIATHQPEYNAQLNDYSAYRQSETSYNWSNTSDVWQRWEYYQKLNTYGCTINVDCDGVVEYWIDADFVYSRNDYLHRNIDNMWTDFRLGHMVYEFADTARAWFDDVFIATSRARVEIGNAATWSGCTHREIQRHTSWAIDEITIIVNAGAFAPTDTAYLYVVDADGAVNETGYAITFGDTGEAPTISAPSGFRTGGGSTWK